MGRSAKMTGVSRYIRARWAVYVRAPGETEERPGQVSNHSTQNFQAHSIDDSDHCKTSKDVFGYQQHLEKDTSQGMGQRVQDSDGGDEKQASKVANGSSQKGMGAVLQRCKSNS